MDGGKACKIVKNFNLANMAMIFHEYIILEGYMKSSLYNRLFFALINKSSLNLAFQDLTSWIYSQTMFKPSCYVL